MVTAFDYNKKDEVTIATCLTLPLSATRTPSETDPPRCTKNGSLTVSDAYAFEPSLGILRLRLRRERSMAKSRIGKYFKDLQERRMILHRFFQRRIGLPSWFGLPPGTLGTVDFRPFLKGISFDPSPAVPLAKDTAKSAASERVHRPVSHNWVGNTSGVSRSSIVPQPVWYRALCDRLPIASDSVGWSPTPILRLRAPFADMFLTLCLTSSLLAHENGRCGTQSGVLYSIKNGPIPPYPMPSWTSLSHRIQKPSPQRQVINSALVSIWDAYWRHIFDNAPFSAPSVTDEHTLENPLINPLALFGTSLQIRDRQ